MQIINTLPRLLALAGALVAAGIAGAQPLGGDRPRIDGSLTIDRAVETALRDNLAIRASLAEASAAAQETRAVRAMTRPQLSANTYLLAGSMSALYGSSPGVSPPNILSAPANGFADQNITLMAPIYTGGRLENTVRAAAGRERAAQRDIETARADAALMVRDAYLRALLASEMARVAEARRDAARASVKTAQALFEAGKGLEASVARSQAEQAEAERMLATARNDQAKMLIDLKRAMGVRLDSDIALADSLAPSPPKGTLESALAEAEAARPELRAARARLEAARAQAGAARGALQPQVYGAAMADVFAPDAMGKRGGASAGIVISIPLLDAGQRRAEAGQMEAMRLRAEAALKDLELRVAAEVRQVWLDQVTATQNIRTAESAVKAAQTAYDVAALRVQNEKAILVEQLDALAAVVQARTGVAQARYDQAIAAARLRRAIGRP